jgi:hypothetical protein
MAVTVMRTNLPRAVFQCNLTADDGEAARKSYPRPAPSIAALALDLYADGDRLAAAGEFPLRTRSGGPW